MQQTVSDMEALASTLANAFMGDYTGTLKQNSVCAHNYGAKNRESNHFGEFE